MLENQPTLVPHSQPMRHHATLIQFLDSGVNVDERQTDTELICNTGSQ